MGDFKGGKNMLKKYLFKDGVFSLSLNIFIFFAQLSLIRTLFFTHYKVTLLLYKKLIRPILKLDRTALFTPIQLQK